MTAEEIRVIITAQNEEFNSRLNDVIDRINDMDNRTRGYGDSAVMVFKKIAQTISALGIGKIISDSITSGGELEQNLGGVEVVFRQHAETMRNTAKSAYKDMGLSESGYLAAANKMGALLKGSGFDIARAADITQQAMQRAADVASIMGVDVTAAMEAVTGAAKGNFTMMDNLGVAINDTTLQIYAQEKGLGKLETTQQKVNAAMQMFLEKTEYAAGNYARENDTFSGSLTTLKAELENLKSSLGTELLPTASALISMTRTGLETISPLVISFGDGLNRVAGYLINLSPAAKTLLAVSLMSAAVIPAVTKAQLLYNAAKGKWNALLSVLIPKQITMNSLLKASAGWLSIIAILLAGVAQIGAARRTVSETTDDLDENAESAGNASENVDDLSESYQELGEAAKKSLADIDKLNRLSGSSTTAGGIDFSAVSEGAQNAIDDLGDFKGAIDEVNSGISDLNTGLDLSMTVSDVINGFKTIYDAFDFNSETQLESLRTLNDGVKQIFGVEWTDFWEDVGHKLYSIFNGTDSESYRALSDLNDHFKENLGEFGETWSNNWTIYGQELYEIMNSDDSWYIKAVKVLGETLDALFFGNDGFGRKWKDFWFEQGGNLFKLIEDTTPKTKEEKDEVEQIILAELGDKEKILLEDTIKQNSEKYSYYSYAPQPQDFITPTDYSNGAQNADLGNIRELEAEVQPFVIEQTTYVQIDGETIGEAATTYASRQESRSNGY